MIHAMTQDFLRPLAGHPILQWCTIVLLGGAAILGPLALVAAACHHLWLSRHYGGPQHGTEYTLRKHWTDEDNQP